MNDFRTLVGAPRLTLVERLVVVVGELANLHQEVGMVQATEKRARVMGFMQSEEPTVAARERTAEANALESTCELFTLHAQLRSLAEEKELLFLLLGTDDGRS